MGEDLNPINSVDRKLADPKFRVLRGYETSTWDKMPLVHEQVTLWQERDLLKKRSGLHHKTSLLAHRGRR